MQGGGAAVAGTIRDAETRRPIPHATVTLVSVASRSDVSTEADADGRYLLEHVEPDVYDLWVESRGYVTFRPSVAR